MKENTVRLTVCDSPPVFLTSRRHLTDYTGQLSHLPTPSNSSPPNSVTTKLHQLHTQLLALTPTAPLATCHRPELRRTAGPLSGLDGTRYVTPTRRAPAPAGPPGSLPPRDAAADGTAAADDADDDFSQLINGDAAEAAPGSDGGGSDVQGDINYDDGGGEIYVLKAGEREKKKERGRPTKQGRRQAEATGECGGRRNCGERNAGTAKRKTQERMQGVQRLTEEGSG